MLLIAKSAYLYGQTIEVYEAFSILLVVIAFSEGGDIFAVKRIFRPYASLDNIALIELEANLTTYHFLGLIDKCRERLSQSGEPLAVIYKVCKGYGQLGFHVHGVLIKRYGLKVIMRGIKNGTARSFVNAATLHANEAIFDNIKDAYAVLAAKLVELADDI